MTSSRIGPVDEPVVPLPSATQVRAEVQQVTPGRAFHWLGVPHVSGIAGPTYLLKVTDNGAMDKFDADLASRQIGFYADVVRRLDRADRTALYQGDPTLGQDGGAERTVSTETRARPSHAREAVARTKCFHSTKHARNGISSRAMSSAACG